MLQGKARAGSSTRAGLRFWQSRYRKLRLILIGKAFHRRDRNLGDVSPPVVVIR
jgi:hypothetical protein